MTIALVIASMSVGAAEQAVTKLAAVVDGYLDLLIGVAAR